MSRESTFFTSYQKFQSCIRFYGYFHIAFISFLCLQLLCFLLFFSYFSQSLVAAFSIALFFLTIFSYFVLLFFFQAKKPEQLLLIRSEFIDACEKQTAFSANSPEYLLTLSSALEEFSTFLGGQSFSFYTTSLSSKALAPLIEKFNIWLHWKNFHSMQEMLLLESAKRLISLIKQAPMDLEAHGNLAEIYMQLSKLYVHPKKLDLSFLWISPDYFSSEMQEKFLFYSKKAIEEFKILESCSSSDAWIYAHLAEIYRLQERPEEEILQCEKLLEISAQNIEVLFRLGVLYFQQGMNAKALKLYETLLQESPEKAAALIEHYDSFSDLP
jgi:tetratricopeptide (TPR) repeat protein